MSNRIAVFDDGVIQQLAAPDMLYEAPENAFVAQFIGENNTFHGKVTGIDGEICTVEMPSGDTLKALVVNIEGVGHETMISLRPERVEVNPERGQCSSTVSGKVCRSLIDYLKPVLNTKFEAEISTNSEKTFFETSLLKHLLNPKNLFWARIRLGIIENGKTCRENHSKSQGASI